MSERNKPTPKQILGKIGLSIAIAGTGLASVGCDNNEKVQYPHQGVYSGPTLRGKNSLSVNHPEVCSVNPGDIEITGRIFNFLGIDYTEIKNDEGETCWVESTIGPIARRTE